MYLQHCLAVTWLIAHETTAVSVRSVYIVLQRVVEGVRVAWPFILQDRLISSYVHTLGEAEIVCTTAVPGLVECIQHHPATLDVEEANGDGCQLNRRSVDLLFPNRHVRISNSTSEVLSNEIRTNTGAPQGCVLSPALFTLYTSDCRCGAEGLSTSKVFR